MALRTVGVRLVAEIGDYTRNMRQAGQTARSFAGDLNEAAKAGKLDAVADQAAGMGLALGAVAGSAIKLSMDFEKSMSAVSAATHAGAKDLGQLRDAAIEAGKSTQYSATEAADAITELSKAGIATSQILGGALDGALDLAAAGQLDVAEAAETAASAMTQFKLKGGDVPHIADLLAAGAGKAQGSVHDMGQALNQAGLIASQTGLSIEETTGGLAAFASAGLMGSDAGTSFKQMLLMLQAPSDKSKALMDDLGISLYDAQGKFIGLSKFAGQLRVALKDLTPEARAAALAQIFGADATRAASIVYENGAEGIQSWIDKVNDAGYASDTAARLTDNLAGDIERLKGSFETLAIESGGAANGGLRYAAKAMNALVDQFGQLPSAVGGSVVIVAGLTGALALGLAGWIKTRAAIASAVVELNAVGPAGARAATGLQLASKWAGRAAVAFVGLEVVGAVADKLGAAEVNVTKLTSALQDYATTGKLTQGLTDTFGKDLDNFAMVAGSAEAASHGFWGSFNDAISSVPGVSSVVDSFNEALYGTSFNDATDKMKALDESFSAFIATQKDAGKAGDLWNDLIHRSGLETDQLANLLPNAWKGLVDLQAAAHSGATSQEDLAAQAEKSAEAIQEQKDQVEALNKALADMFDQQMSADRASIKLEESTVSLAKELKDGKATLSLNSEEGRKNRTAVLDQLEAIEALRKARISEGESTDSASKKYVKGIEALRKQMIQAGFSKTAVDELIGAYKDIPEQVSTEIDTPGLPSADHRVQDYGKRLDDLARYIKTTVSIEGKERAQREIEQLLILQQAAKKGISVSAASSAFRKNAAGYHDGGRTADVGEFEPAGVVHGDEYVIRKKSRRRIEQKYPGLLDEMNATGQVPGYARGGMVMPFPVSVAGMKIPSRAEALGAVAGNFGDWPSSPGAQRGDSGVWRKVVALIRSTGPLSGSFGNSYRPGDPLWHGSGRAVDWMGYNQDALATFLSHQRPLELIHRTKQRDYAYTRGRDKGSFNNALMEAHRNHIHIAMARGGTITEPVFGVGASGRTYSFGENYMPERVTPVSGSGGEGGSINVTVQAGYVVSERQLEDKIAETIDRLRTRRRI